MLILHLSDNAADGIQSLGSPWLTIQARKCLTKRFSISKPAPILMLRPTSFFWPITDKRCLWRCFGTNVRQIARYFCRSRTFQCIRINLLHEICRCPIHFQDERFRSYQARCARSMRCGEAIKIVYEVFTTLHFLYITCYYDGALLCGRFRLRHPN